MNSKLKLSLGIITFAIAFLLLATGIFWIIGANNDTIKSAFLNQMLALSSNYDGESVVVQDMYTLAIVAFVGAFIFGIISNRIIASYRNNDDDGKGITALYILSFLPLSIVGIVILIIIGVIWLIHVLPTVDNQSSSSSYKRTVNVRDHVGYDRKLEYDNNTETWRDSLGNHYTTKDEGKTFNKK